MRPKRRRIPGVKTHRRKLKRILKIDSHRLKCFIKENLSDFGEHDGLKTILSYYSDLESEGFVSVDKYYGKPVTRRSIFYGSVSDLISSYKSHCDENIHDLKPTDRRPLSSINIILLKYTMRMKSIERIRYE